MDAKLKRNWLKALRSGQYEQGRAALCNNAGDKFCCLGVLADIQGARWKEIKEYGISHLVPITRGDTRHCGINSDQKAASCYIRPSRAGGLPIKAQVALANMNDNGRSFEGIADWIDANL